jgi:hypothetical protein
MGHEGRGVRGEGRGATNNTQPDADAKPGFGCVGAWIECIALKQVSFVRRARAQFIKTQRLALLVASPMAGCVCGCRGPGMPKAAVISIKIPN